MRTVVALCGYIKSGKSTAAEMLCSVDPAGSVHIETSTVVMGIANQLLDSLPNQAATDEATVISATNHAIDCLRPTLAQMAGRSIEYGDVSVEPEDIANNPEWYEKLFAFNQTAVQEPGLFQNRITVANKDDYRHLMQWVGGYFLYRIDPLLWYNDLYRQIAAMPSSINFVALTAPRQPLESEYVQAKGDTVIRMQRPSIHGDSAEVTEKRIAEIKPDSELYNDVSLTELERCLQTVRYDLINHALQPEYRTSTF